jgi:hypothetical protein
MEQGRPLAFAKKPLNEGASLAQELFEELAPDL